MIAPLLAAASPLFLVDAPPALEAETWKLTECTEKVREELLDVAEEYLRPSTCL